MFNARVFYYKFTGKDSYQICTDLQSFCWFKWRKELELEEINYDEVSEGDLVVLSGGPVDHIAIVSEVTSEGFHIVQQNFFNDERDLGYFINFETLKNNQLIMDDNADEYLVEFLLRIRRS